MTGYILLKQVCNEIGIEYTAIGKEIVFAQNNVSITIPLQQIIDMYGVLSFMHFDQRTTMYEIILQLVEPGLIAELAKQN